MRQRSERKAGPAAPTGEMSFYQVSQETNIAPILCLREKSVDAEFNISSRGEFSREVFNRCVTKGLCDACPRSVQNCTPHKLMAVLALLEFDRQCAHWGAANF